MAWARYLEIPIVVNNRRGSPVAMGLANRARLDAVELVSHDTFPLRFRFVEEPASNTEPLTPVRLPEGFAIVLAAKALANLGASELLFFADDFAEVADGENGFYYEAILNTNTLQLTEAIAALSGTQRVLPVLVDVEVQTADNSERTTFQFRANIARQVYAGTEGLPEDGTPVYPAPAELLVRTPRFRLGETGDPEHYSDALEKWVRVTLAGEPPQLTLTELETEEEEA